MSRFPGSWCNPFHLLLQRQYNQRRHYAKLDICSWLCMFNCYCFIVKVKCFSWLWVLCRDFFHSLLKSHSENYEHVFFNLWWYWMSQVKLSGRGRFCSNPDVVTKFVGLFRIWHKVWKFKRERVNSKLGNPNSRLVSSRRNAAVESFHLSISLCFPWAVL